MWLAVACLAAWTMRRWNTAAVTVVLVVACISPILIGVNFSLSRLHVLSTAELEAAEWAAAATPPRSVFVTDGWLHSFTDVAGRLRNLVWTLHRKPGIRHRPHTDFASDRSP